MNPYGLCRHCARHIKRDEAACPFCGEATIAEPSRRGALAIRAQWLAYGSALTALGCTTGAPARPQSPDATAPSEVNAQGADQGEATTGDAPADAAEPMFAPADGSFPCFPTWAPDGSRYFVTCDRATQYCFLQGGSGYPADGCQSFACGPNSPSDAGCGPIGWDAAACNGGVRRCSCLSVPCAVQTCSDDDAGGVMLSCGQCYGAPPARRRGARVGRGASRLKGAAVAG